MAAAVVALGMKGGRVRRAAEVQPRAPVGSLDTLDAETMRVRGPSGRLYTKTSCLMLPGQCPRSVAIRLVEHWLFDPCVLVVILANCGTMAWASPLDPSGTVKEHVLEVCEDVFLGIFTLEMSIKIVAYGFMGHRHAYLHDAWCQLDFVVVTLAWLPIVFPTLGNYSALRAFRALRPLRALKRVPGMPMLVQWILSVLPKMANVLLLCGFVFLVFGIVGMELFKGSLHQRCAADGFDAGADEEAQAAYDTGVSCRIPSSAVAGAAASSSVGGGADGSGGSGSSGGFECPAGTACARFRSNPSHGVNSFDSVGAAFIAFIQAITFDDWATPMYALMGSFSPYAWVYFLLVLAVGGFFVVNLFLAVIFMEYGHTREHADGLTTRRTDSTARSSSSGGRTAAINPLDGRTSAEGGGRTIGGGVSPRARARASPAGAVAADEEWRSLLAAAEGRSDADDRCRPPANAPFTDDPFTTPTDGRYTPGGRPSPAVSPAVGRPRWRQPLGCCCCCVPWAVRRRCAHWWLVVEPSWLIMERARLEHACTTLAIDPAHRAVRAAPMSPNPRLPYDRQVWLAPCAETPAVGLPGRCRSKRCWNCSRRHSAHSRPSRSPTVSRSARRRSCCSTLC